MAKIGLIDVESHNFPNLALMKLSAYHKEKGDKVELIDTPIEALLGNWDKVYKSKIFTNSLDEFANISSSKVIKGGTGYDLKNKLSKEIEAIYPDYNLYSNPKFDDTAYGFLTRGCPRDCSFCIVSQKEGKCSKKVANLDQFWRGQKKIKLLDPNLLASKDKYNLLKQLVESRAKVDVTQGFDIRLLDDKSVELINALDLETIHFAWDNYEFKTYKKLKKYRDKLKFNKRKLIVYVLINYNTTIEQDLERLYKLRELSYSPYVMIYDKHKLPSGDIKRRMQRWVNNRYIWYSGVDFKDYRR
mgnify:CR=1 FL=1